MELSHEMIPPSLRPKTFSINESDNAELQQLLSEVNTLTSEKSLCEIQFNEKQQAVKNKRAEISSLELRLGTVNATLVERQQRITEKQNEFNDIQNRREKTMKDIHELEQQIKDETHSIETIRMKITELSVESNDQQEIRQNVNRIKEEKMTLESRLMSKQQQLNQIKLDLQRYQQIVDNQKSSIEEYLKSDQKDSPAAIAQLTAKFQRVSLPKVATSTSSDPFGLPFNAFGSSGNDPFGAPRTDDPFAASSSSGTNQKLDETDPFRPADFTAAQESMKKSMANRSKTPGANMFGGSDFTSTAINRPQSAMPWEPTRAPQPGTKTLTDLFDVFG